MPGFLAFETEVVVKASLLFFWVSFSIRMASTSIALGSFFFWMLWLFLLSWKARNGLPHPLVISSVFSQMCLKWSVCVYHFFYSVWDGVHQIDSFHELGGDSS